MHKFSVAKGTVNFETDEPNV